MDGLKKKIGGRGWQITEDDHNRHSDRNLEEETNKKRKKTFSISLEREEKKGRESNLSAISDGGFREGTSSQQHIKRER